MKELRSTDLQGGKVGTGWIGIEFVETVVEMLEIFMGTYR